MAAAVFEKRHTKALLSQEARESGQVLRTAAATFRANIQLHELFSGNSIFMKLNEPRNFPVKAQYDYHNLIFLIKQMSDLIWFQSITYFYKNI